MADGSKKPIRQVRLGDKVMAADPVTGVEGPRKVVDLIRHSGVHVMVAVHLSDGGVLNATDHHRFWVANRQAWVDAIDLKAGDQVVDRDGDQVVVAGVGISEQDLTAYNLTVAGLHTYFVGKANILVHNQGEACPIAAESADDVAQVTKNRIAGNEFRDLVATRLEAEEGFTVLQKEFGVRTPFGWRYIDILAQRNGGLINFETKLGKSRYLLSQRVKDWWISRVGADVYGDGTLTKIPAVLIRGPLN